METMPHLLESGLYEEEEFFYAHHLSALAFLNAARGLATEDREDCESCFDVSNLMDEYFEFMEAAKEVFRNYKRKPAEDITPDELSKRLSPGDVVTALRSNPPRKESYYLVKELPKKENSPPKPAGNKKQTGKAA